MSIANTGRMRRRPTHPGEMLREDFLPDYGLTAQRAVDLWDAAQAIKDDVAGIKTLSAA